MGQSEEKKRVLIADSEAWSVELFTKGALKFGVEVHSSKNGIDAIEKFKTLTPALVVVDTLLPKLDGLQVAAKIHDMELGRITPIIVTSAIYKPGPDVDRLKQTFGFTDFLEKPFRLEDVERLFLEYLPDESEAPSGEREAFEDGHPVKLPEITQLALTEMGVPALLKQLFRAKKSGILTVRQADITKVLFFENGLLTHASSNSRRDRLGRILLRNKRISLDDYERARRLQIDSSGGMQLGHALVQSGALNENDVINAVSSQILSIVFSLFSWTSGTWSFLETTYFSPNYKRFNFNTANIIFWGLRQLEGHKKFGAFLPSPKAVVERGEDSEATRETLHLTYFEEQILSLVDGRKRLGEIVAIGRLAQIDVERVLFSLLVVGVLRVPAENEVQVGDATERGMAGDTGAIDKKGDLERTSVGRLFGRLYLNGLAGRVSFERGKQEISVWVDRGEIVYASSNGDEHQLATILFKAGKVSRTDHDRAVQVMARRSEKKIGAVFLELRALSLDELHWALRFQVQQIVLDLFQWRSGSYSFESGEAPADLMLTLAATTPNLILEGVRSTEAPPGIAGLLLSTDTLLMRQWTNQRVSRLLQLSSAETRLLDYIETGRSIQDVRALGLMSDSELASILHGLLALEVVKAARGAAYSPPSPPSPVLTPGQIADDARSADDEEEVTGEINLVELRRRTAAAAAPVTGDLSQENRELKERLRQLEDMVKALQKPPA